MVLQEATNDAFNSFPTDGVPPSSDTDPFAAPSADNPQRVSYNIDYSTLQSPVPVLGSLLGYGSRALHKRVHLAVQNGSQLMRRPMTLTEAQATAEYQAQSIAIASYGGAAGLAAGGYRCYKTAPQYKFPFVKAMEPTEFDPNMFGPLRGQAARVARHSLRAMAYISFGIFVGDVLAQGYASATTAVGFYRDERVKEVVEAIRRTTEERRSGLPRDAVGRPGGMGGSGGVGAGQGQGQGQQQQDRPRSNASWNMPRRRDADDDDMSPKTMSDTGLLSDEDMRSRELRQRASARSSPTESRDDTFRMENVTSQPKSFDDDSPTGGAGRSSSYVSDSAWDRIRRGAASEGSQSPRSRAWPPRDQQREREQGATLGDSFAFSSTEEERQLAKSEAQKDFDARIERERRGGDFNEGGKRW